MRRSTPRHLAPGERRARAARTAGEPWSVRRALAVALAALALAALLDAEALEHTARSQPFGWRRDLAVALAEPLADLSRSLHLTAPRHWLEDAFGRPSTRPAGPPTSLPTTTTPTTTAPTTEPGTTGTTTSSTEPPTTTSIPSRRTPTADDPLRLLIAGDSMTESVGPALLRAGAATGVVDAHHDLHYSSGLTRPDFFDWPARLATLLAEHDPEVVVVFIGANDAQGIQTPTGPAAFGTDAYVAEYRARVAAVMELLTAGGRDVYWIGQPAMRSASFDERMRLLTSIYESEAARHPGVRFVDSHPVLAGPEGGYSAYLPDASDNPVLVRRDDGIHLTPAGADRLVDALLAVIRTEWSLP